MYQLRDTAGHFVSRAHTKAAAHRASRQRNRAGTTVLNCAHGKKANMARLSSKGRTELARVSKEGPLPEGSVATWEKVTRTLMSDRTVLEKRDVRFKPDQYDPKGKFHSYGWKVFGKLKEGLDPQSFADIYAKKGYTVEKVASYGTLAEYKKPKPRATRPSVPRPATIARREREREAARGFYVVNSTTDGIKMGPEGPYEQLAANHGPFATLDEALPVAWAQLQEYMQMKFTYLLPVKIIESESKDAAEHGVGRVWWTNGKRTGAPVPAEQTRFANMARSKMSAEDRLFIGVYPGGIVYSDRAREVGGDYKRLAFLPYDTLELRLQKGVPADLRKLIESDAQAIQARRGQEFQISSSGQTVMLGRAS